MKLRKVHYCFIGSMIGIIGFFFLPYGFKFFAFIIPVILLSMVLSSEDDYLNIHIFIILLIIFFLIPSNLFTFDAGNPINTESIVTGIYATTSIIIMIGLVGVPIFMAVSVIWAFSVGRANEAVTTLVRLIVFAIFAIVMLTIMVYAGYEWTGGTTGWLIDLYFGLIVAIFRVPEFIYNLVNTAIAGYNGIAEFIEEAVRVIPVFRLISDLEIPRLPYLPDLPVYNADISGIGFDSSRKTLNSEARNYPQILYTVHDSLPLLISGVCFVTGIFMIKQEWEQRIEDLITNISKDDKKPKKEYIYHSHVNLKMLIYMFILMFSAFIIFLGYDNSFGEDPREDYRYFGFFSIYMFMAIIPLILFQLQGFTYYKDSNLYNTIEGTVYGTAVLFLITRLFYTVPLIEAYSVLNLRKDVAYLVNTFIFVAPAESIFFHIFYPALVAGAIKQHVAKKRSERIEITDRDMLLEYELEIIFEGIRAEVFKEKGYKEDYEATMEYLALLKEEKVDFEGEIDVDLDEKSIFGRTRSNALFIFFALFLGSFLFALIHWVIPFMEYGLDFITFWTCGLGIIFLCGGMWMIYIGIRFGWLSCILTHAIFNTLTILITIAVLGV